MSETPTPAKRRGLALPPRGQALARLQDLEREAEPGGAATGVPEPGGSAAEVSNAVNTASSNAVMQSDSKTLMAGGGAERVIAHADQATPVVPPQNPPRDPHAGAASGSRRQTPIRAVREPTTRITVDMPDSLHRKISLLSVETRRSIKDLVIEALATTYFGADGDSD